MEAFHLRLSYNEGIIYNFFVKANNSKCCFNMCMFKDNTQYLAIILYFSVNALH